MDSRLLDGRIKSATFRMPALFTLFFGGLILSLLYFLEYEMTLVALFMPLWMLLVGVVIFIVMVAVPGWMIGYPMGLLSALVYHRFRNRLGDIVEMLRENGLDHYPFHQIGLFASVPLLFIFISLHKHHFGTVFDAQKFGSYLIYAMALVTSLLINDIIELAVHSAMLSALPAGGNLDSKKEDKESTDGDR